jgi:hypothetical protein
MEWRIGICGTPSKNFSKKFEKPLDKTANLWYTKHVSERDKLHYKPCPTKRL